MIRLRPSISRVSRWQSYCKQHAKYGVATSAIDDVRIHLAELPYCEVQLWGVRLTGVCVAGGMDACYDRGVEYESHFFG